jgi:hydrogenase maturation protease
VTRRILVAGLGNVFLGDDGFGVAVVDQLAREPLPDGIEVMDVGVRTLHLAYQLVGGAGYDLLVAVDAVARGGPPGTLYVIEPDLPRDAADVADAHGADLAAVSRMVAALGGDLGRVLLVGCEPATLDGMGLSPPVAAAVLPAARRVRAIFEEGAATS